MPAYKVCFEVHGTSSAVTINDKPALAFEIPSVTQATNFEFYDGGTTCPASEAGHFSIYVAPDPASEIPNVKVSEATATNPGRIAFTDLHTKNDQVVWIKLNMRLAATSGSVPGSTIASGKPVIRNDPYHQPPFTWLGIGLLILVVAYVAYRWWRGT